MLRSSLDRSFLRFCRHGDPRALAAVFDRAAPELWKVAACLCRDRHAVEDVVQGTFLTAIECKDEWDEARPVLPWLLGLLVNRVRSEHRRRRQQPDVARVALPRGERDPAEIAAAGEVHESLRAALRELAEPYRSALEQHLVAQRSAAELASKQGLSPGAMRMRLHRGLDLLRRRLPASLAAVPVAVPLTPASHAAMREVVLRDSVLAHGAVVPAALGVGVMAWLAVPAAALLVVAFAFGRGMFAATPVVPSTAVGGELQEDREAVAGAGQGVMGNQVMADAPSIERERVVTAGRLRVVVTKQDEGAPIVGARVEVMQGQRAAPAVAPVAGSTAPAADVAAPVTSVATVAANDVQRGTTDAAGVASFELAAGLVSVQVTSPSFERREVTIEADREAECRIELPARVAADVTVVDAAGRPAAGARILGRRGLHKGALDELELGRTDGDGRWCATFVEESVLVRAVRAGNAASDATVLVSRTGKTTLRLGPPAAILRGVVFARDGRPMPMAGVAIRSAASPVPLVVRVGRDGAFACDYVTPGPCHVYAWHVVDERQRFAVAEVEAVAGKSSDVDVRFTGGARIVADVRRPDGSVIFGVSVIATPERRLGAGFDLGGSLRTGAGSGVLDGLLPGRYELRAQCGSDLRTETVDLVEGQEHRFASVFDMGAAVDLEVVDAQGAPLVGWWVHVVAADLGAMERGHGVPSRTDAGGRARLRGLPARRMLATVRRQSEGLVALAQQVEPSHPARLVVTDACTGSVRGVIVPAPGAPLPQLRLELQRMPDAATPLAFDRHDRTSAVLAPDGSFAFSFLPAGRYAFSAMDQGAMRMASWRLDIDLQAGGVVDLGRIEIAPGTIRVHASRDDGRPIKDLVVSLGRRGDGAFGLLGASATPGSELQDLPPAEYEVLVWGTDIAPTRVPVTLAPGARVEVPVIARAATPVTFRCVDLPENAAFGSVRLHRNGAVEVGYLLTTAGAPHTRGLLPGHYRFEFTAGPRGDPGRWVAECEVGAAPLTVDAVRTP